MQVRGGMHNSLGVLNQIRYTITREGSANRLVREDGTVDNIESRKLAVEIKIPVKEAETWTAAQSARKLEEISNEMARQKASLVFEKIHEVTEQVGNVIDAQGNYSEEHYFAMLRQIRIEFTSDGVPRMPQVVGGIAEKVFLVQSRILGDPKLREQLASILEQKREEWREREASRTLVG